MNASRSRRASPEVAGTLAAGQEEWTNGAASGTLPAHCRQVGSGTVAEGAPFVTLATGSRFTASVEWPGRAVAPIASLAGQLVLQSHEAEESLVLDVLRRTHGQLAAAQALCDGGVVQIYRAVCLLSGVRVSRASAAQVALAAVRAQSPECGRAIAIFCGLLGDMAGRAALALGSGGVIVNGATVARLGNTFDRSPFRRRFEEAGRYPEVLRAIPTFVDQGRPQEAAAGGAWTGVRRYGMG